MPQQTPPPPPLPVPAIAQVGGGTATGSPSDIYIAFRAQRQELNRQLQGLEERRTELTREIQQTPGNELRTGLEARIREVDQRISAVDQQIAQSDAAVARAAAVPGAVVEPPRFVRPGPPDEVYILAGMFMVVVLLPLSIALARRLWRRGSAVAPAIPSDLGERFTRLEQAVDAIAVEVERVGENQRFVAKHLTENGAPKALGAGAAEPIDVKQRDADRVERR